MRFMAARVGAELGPIWSQMAHALLASALFGLRRRRSSWLRGGRRTIRESVGAWLCSSGSMGARPSETSACRDRDSAAVALPWTNVSSVPRFSSRAVKARTSVSVSASSATSFWAGDQRGDSRENMALHMQCWYLRGGRRGLVSRVIVVVVVGEVVVVVVVAGRA